MTEELHHELGQVPSEFPFLIGNEGTEKKKDSLKQQQENLLNISERSRDC